MHRIGLCDNPLTRTQKLIPGSYFLCLHGGVLNFKKKIKNMGAVELQFQLFEEVPKDRKKLLSYVKNARDAGLDVIAHAPFIEDRHSGRPLDMDFVWAVVPEKYKNAPVMKVGSIAVNAKPAKMSEYRRFLGLLGYLKIPAVTVHVTKSGALLSAPEWWRYLSFLKKIKTVADHNKVTLAIETGGMLDRHIKDVLALGLHINFDTAHYYLEMRKQGKTAAQANTLVIKAFKRFHEGIAVMHMSQPETDFDAHRNLLDKKGALTCNDAVLKLAHKYGVPHYIILETMPDKKAVDHIHNILNC
jgi:hypothetical protein